MQSLFVIQDITYVLFAENTAGVLGICVIQKHMLIKRNKHIYNF